jgi:hypothetical protein
MSKSLATLILLVFSSFLFGQAPQVVISGQTVQGLGSAHDTFKVYMESLTGNSIKLRSATLSILHNSSCSNYDTVTYSLFTAIWNQNFQSSRVNTLPAPISPAPSGGALYNRRLLYTNTSFFRPPAYVIIPVAPAKVEVLNFTFAGGCTDKVYMEDESEYILSQLGDSANNTVPFIIRRDPTLPVEYASMNAEAVSSVQVDINWTTARELNSAFFEVEKSFTADFTESEIIAQLQGAVYSETETNYSVSDRGAMAPVVYYRLRQVDLDGSVNLSNAMSVNFGENSAFTLTAFPNPFEDQVTVKVDKGSMERYTLRVMDATGRTMYEAASEMSMATQDSWTLNLGRLPHGTYFVQAAEIGGEGRQEVFKLMK